MPSVPYTEKAFLQLMGRRLLRYTREAEARGEEYHDLSAFAPLQCGVLAKYRFETAPGGYIPVVRLRGTTAFTPSDLKEIAAEILEGPVKLREAVEDDLEYVRELDSGTSAPG
jgi:hypothetical protein